MKKLMIIVFLILSGYSYSQIDSTFISLLTEYSQGPHKVASPYEWITREISISTDTISIFSKGKLDNHFQQWKVNNYENNHDTYGTNQTYYTHLIRDGEDPPSPAIFRVLKNTDERIEIIEWEVPTANEFSKPLITRFHID
ncbi:hypothetical protein [Gramella sp. AN32]|uniref:Uncharacterized protein n=1 Tax=Christiangramia antarctica TaxID=2058158 RepID=A0ABW5XAI1_9FLAO|nr:hypothetical protein [Gramella sp. AN32]MCM4157620.1 hypothetical protein [Gramella sp. AN32]